jgi:tetratricopeptide (TPR) repeat protein
MRRNEDGWQSGLMRTLGKRVCPQGNQGSNPCPSASRRPHQNMPALLLILLLVFGATAGFANTPAAGVDPLDSVRRELQNGNIDDALAALNEAEKAGKPTAQSHTFRGVIALEQGRTDDALAAFRTALETEPAYFPPRIFIGDALLRAKRWEQARDAYLEAARKTNILTYNERVRYAIMLTHMGENRAALAREAFERITFPTESPAYYYAQAAWAYANGDKRGGDKWLRTGDEIFPERATDWFARPLHDFGWIKRKPAPAVQ